jgi:signal transduction histidine kinase
VLVSDKFVILVVDDNENNRFTLNALLGRLANTEIVEAFSGEEALLLTLTREIHLILLDVQMPVMDGYETAKHLMMTERTRNIPIVFVTAFFKSDEFIKRGYTFGAVDYLTKPLDENLLINRIQLYHHLNDKQKILEERNQTLYDLTAQLQRVIDDLRLTQKKLVQTEKLAALGSLVAGVAHELNTPIGNSVTVASTLNHQIDELESEFLQGAMRRSQLQNYFGTSHGALDLLLRSLQQAAELVNNFKQVAAIQGREDRCSFVLKDLIDDVVTLQKIKLGKTSYRLKIDIPAELRMDSYPGAIEKVLSCLIDNSVLHGFCGQADGLISLSATREAENICLIYSDDGCGMKDEVMRRIFEPFFTTRLGTGNCGLGMNIFYNLITGPLGGSVEVASVLGEGSRFTISFPVVAPDTDGI